MSESELVFYAIGALFIGFIIIGIAKENNSGKYARQLPNKPEMLTGQQRPPEMQGNFDSSALQTARAMISEVERYPDPTSRTLALAEMIHRQKAYEARQADRAYQEQRKESDALERVLALADRLSGRPAIPDQRAAYPPFPDPRARRINDWHDNRRLAESEYWNGGYWK